MIRIHRRLDSETLHLRQLRSLLGRSVQIIIREETKPQITPGRGDRAAAEQAAECLRETGYDFDAWPEQRAYNRRHGQGTETG